VAKLLDGNRDRKVRLKLEDAGHECVR
jgi:hypothetical protein